MRQVCWNPGWLVMVVVVLGAGCGSNECEKLYEKQKQCGERKLPDKDLFVSACKLARDSGDAQEMDETLACAQKSTCEEFDACNRGRSARRRSREIEKNLAAGKVKDAFDSCTTFEDSYREPQFKAACDRTMAAVPGKLTGEDLESAARRCAHSEEIAKASPEFVAACASMARTLFDGQVKVVEQARDAGKRDFKTCMDLERYGKMIGAEATARAKAVCEEAELSASVSTALARARANAQSKDISAPYQCDSLPDKLIELGTPWAQRTADELIRVCHVELGLATLAAESASSSAKYVCPFRIKNVQAAAAKYKLAEKYPQLAEALTTVPPKCK
ncbi:MAG: hypothetical protein ACTHU0_14905 [Kofleriaceae bacterium]